MPFMLCYLQTAILRSFPSHFISLRYRYKNSDYTPVSTLLCLQANIQLKTVAGPCSQGKCSELRTLTLLAEFFYYESIITIIHKFNLLLQLFCSNNCSFDTPCRRMFPKMKSYFGLQNVSLTKFLSWHQIIMIELFKSVSCCDY